MSKIDVLAYKFDVDNTDSFNEDIIAYSPNSIIVNWNLNKMWVQYKPDNIKFKKMAVNFFNIRNQRVRYFFSPLRFMAQCIQITKHFILFCWKFRPKIFIVENYLEGMIAGIIRKFNLADKTIYLPADWYAGCRYKKLLSKLANNVIFPYIDYFACKLNDVVVDRQGGRITESRNKYWGRVIPTTKRQLIQPLRIQAINTCLDKKRPNICFIGEMREDSGLDIAIKSLGKLRMNGDFILKIIGYKRIAYEYFMKLAGQYKVRPYVKFLGFVERKDFGEVLSDCFCGINVLTNMNSYSTAGYPAKVTYYFQYLVPVIVSQGLAEFALQNIEDNELGLVIKPDEDNFVEAVLKIYSEQARYRRNIMDYIKSSPKSGIIDILKDEKL